VQRKSVKCLGFVIVPNLTYPGFINFSWCCGNAYTRKLVLPSFPHAHGGFKFMYKIRQKFNSWSVGLCLIGLAGVGLWQYLQPSSLLSKERSPSSTQILASTDQIRVWLNSAEQSPTPLGRVRFKRHRSPLP